MKVILLRDIKNVGRKYQVKEVNDGFARNGLIARGGALPATPENLGKMKAEMDLVVKTAEIKSDLLEKGLKELNDLNITMSAKANPEGHLFAAIHPREIVKELEKISGKQVYKGDKIGKVSNTGSSDIWHLHYRFDYLTMNLYLPKGVTVGCAGGCGVSF